MPVITTTITADERTFQTDFYKQLFGENSTEIKVDRSTDGYTRGILFEHKANIRSYGESKALGQALIPKESEKIVEKNSSGNFVIPIRIILFHLSSAIIVQKI